jgi:hypothetical protein
MNPMLKAPGIKRLKLICDAPLSNVAFNFELRRYILDILYVYEQQREDTVGRCRLTISNPR